MFITCTYNDDINIGDQTKYLCSLHNQRRRNLYKANYRVTSHAWSYASIADHSNTMHTSCWITYSHTMRRRFKGGKWSIVWFRYAYIITGNHIYTTWYKYKKALHDKSMCQRVTNTWQTRCACIELALYHVSRGVTHCWERCHPNDLVTRWLIWYKASDTEAIRKLCMTRARVNVLQIHGNQICVCVCIMSYLAHIWIRYQGTYKRKKTSWSTIVSHPT